MEPIIDPPTLHDAILGLRDGETLKIRVCSGRDGTGQLRGVHLSIEALTPDGNKRALSTTLTLECIQDANIDLLATTICNSCYRLRHVIRTGVDRDG